MTKLMLQLSFSVLTHHLYCFFTTITCGLLLLFFNLLLPKGVSAQTTSESPSLKLLFLTEQNHSEQDALADLHPDFGSVNVDWVHLSIVDIPDAPEAFQSIAEALRVQHQADAVVWCVMARPVRLHIIFRTQEGPTQNGRQLVIRSLDGVGENGIADAIELIVINTANTMLLTQKRQPAPAANNARPVASLSPNRNAPSEMNSQKRSSRGANRPRSRHFLRIGVQYIWQLRAAAPVGSHGGRIFAQRGIASLFDAVFALQLMTPYRDEAESEMIRIRQIPIYLGLGKHLSATHWSVGGYVAAGLSIMTVSPQTSDDGTDMHSSYRHPAFSLESVISLSLRLTGSLFVILDMGTEIFVYRRIYRVIGGSDLDANTWFVQPKGMIGIAWQL